MSIWTNIKGLVDGLHPAQFKKQYPKKLKQGTPPKWATDILKNKPKAIKGYEGQMG